MNLTEIGCEKMDSSTQDRAHLHTQVLSVTCQNTVIFILLL
jgi:hypothetical protein